MADQGLSLPSPTVKGLIAPTPISPFVGDYILLSVDVKLFFGELWKTTPRSLDDTDFKRGLQRFLDFFKNLFWFSQYLEKRFIQKEFNWGQSHNDVTYFTLFG